MEDNSALKPIIVDTALSTKSDINETAGPSKEVIDIKEKLIEGNVDIPDITHDANYEHLSMPDTAMECSSAIDELSDDDKLTVHKTSPAGTEIELDAATEAKLLNEPGDAESAVNKSDEITNLLDKDTEAAGDVNQSSDDLEKLWYDSDDDTIGAENISSAIALLTDDVMDIDSVDAVTEEKLLADSVDISTENKDTLSTTSPSVEDKTEVRRDTEKIQMDNLDDNAMEADNNEIVSLTENETEKTRIDGENSEKPDKSEESVDKEEILNQIDSSNAKNTDSSEKSIFDTENTSDAKSSKEDDINMTEDILLDAESDSENHEKSATDEIQELDEEELLSENKEIVNKTVNTDMIGQSIKAVLETGKCSKYKNIEAYNKDSKEKDNMNTTGEDSSDNNETVENSAPKEVKIDKIDDQENNTIQNIDNEEYKSEDTDILKAKANVEVSENTKDAINTTTPDILDQVINVTIDSSMHIDNSRNIDKDNSQQSNNSNLDILKVDINQENINNTENSSIEMVRNDTIQMDEGDKKSNEIEDTAMQCNANAKADTSTVTNYLSDMSTDKYPIHKKSSHNLHFPDAMLEIPTQELIDIDDVLDSPNDSKVDEFLNKSDEIHKDDKGNDTTDVDKNIEETNCENISENKTNIEKKDIKAPIIEESQPSTSTAYKFTPDTFDDMPETSDSLGLLAESQRVHDEDDDDEGVHDYDDFEHDESSNQMTGEHSEDSNTHHSETEQTKYGEEKDTREEIEDRVSNGSDGDFDEEQSNIDAVEIEEYCVDIDDGEKDGGERDDESEKEDECDKKDESEDEVGGKNKDRCEKEDGGETIYKGEIEDNISDDIDKIKDLKASEIQTIRLKVEGQKGDKLSNDEIIEKDKQINENITTEDNSDLIMVTENAVKDTLKDIKEVKSTKDTVKDSVTKDIKENSKELTVEKSNYLEKDNDQDPDVVDQTPEIPTYNLSDSDNDGEFASAPNKNKRKTVDSPSPTAGVEVKKKFKQIDTIIDGAQTPNKLNEHVESIVDLEESSEDDVLLTDNKVSQQKSSKDKPSSDVITVNIPTDIVVTSIEPVDNTPGIVKTQQNIVVKTPASQKTVTRLNTSEVSIKTSSSTRQPTLVIPEKQMDSGQADVPEKPKMAPVYSIDSDEEETKEQPNPKRKKKCINQSCTGDDAVFRTTDSDIILYYDASRKRRPLICKPCVDAVIARKQSLIDGIKDMVPLSELDMGVASIYPVEILDSDSEDEDTQPSEEPAKEAIGEMAAKFLEENLADMLNSTWKKYNLDERLKETQDEINTELASLNVMESKEINDMLNECQRMTDKLRTDLYATFEPKIQSEPPVIIYETPEFRYIGPELGSPTPPPVPKNRVIIKRKLPTCSSPPLNKRPSVIPLGYAPINDPILKVQESQPPATTSDDDKDVSVVKLSAESPPPDLPPPGELVRPPLKVDMEVYAMKNAFGPWLKGRITEIMPKGVNSSPFTSCRVHFDHITKNNYSKVLHARCIAYSTPPNVRMTIGTRLIAIFKGSTKDANKKVSFSSGVVAEAPTPVNNYRYLVFFDDGYAQYVKHPHTRLVCECSALVWEEVHPFSRDFIKEYLMAFPERPMVRLHQGQNFKTEWNGKWWASRVVQVDASLVQVVFIENGRKEWIYRGSTRLAPLYVELQAAERHRTRASGTRRQPPRNNMPYVEYTRSEEQGTNKILGNLPSSTPLTLAQQKEELRKQRAVAKKSTMPAQPGGKPASEIPDSLTSRVVYYTPKNAVRPYKLVPHKCSPQCKRRVLSLEDLRTYNPLAKPLLSGWERQTIRFKGQKEVMYRAPCGRRLRNMKELHRYLQMTDSELSVDLFDFYYGTHCLAEFQIYKCLTGKKDLSQGKENVPIPCVNYYDHTLPEFCSYNTERTPTSGVPLNLDPEFLCGCDCTDDCEDKTKCACWKMTLEGARTIGLDSPNIGYEYKRLPEPLPSGIYECNSRCKCKNTCLNRVAQHPLQLKLQVFKTLNRGWGIRALNDVPKGAFLCVYAGNLLTDATANLDGLNEGDEYLAELDYIEVVEQMKEGYEADVPEEDKQLDAEQSESSKQEESAEESSSSSEEELTSSRYDKEDDDFKPACNVAPEVSQFSKRLRKRSRDEEKADKEKEKDKDKTDENFITISDDEEAREPSRFAAQTGMDGNELISKHRSVRSYFGEDEACYIMDAKVQGNIGRYLNHSCSPNVFVQNVFVDTHDPRFPWVAFFALSHIKAGTELTWNYNYDVGSVPDKILYCYCQAPNCRGRLL